MGERAKTWQWQLEEDVKTLLERGELDGACGALSRSYDQLCRRLEDFPFAYLDSFALSAYPAAFESGPARSKRRPPTGRS